MSGAKALLVPAGIVSTTADSQPAGFNGLIYAKAKVGKTVLATSIANHPSVTKALHIDIDGSPESLPKSDKLDRAVIQAGAKGWKKVVEIADWLHGPQTIYNAVIVDTLTTLGTYGLDSVLEENFLKRKGTTTEGRLAFPSMGDYGINNRRCLRLVRYFRELSIIRGWHVIFVCHEKTEKAESGAINYKPSLSGQLSDVVPGIPDVLGRLAVGAGGRQLQLSPSKGIACDYRHDPSFERTIPPRINIKSFTNPDSPGMDLADIWSAMLKERQQ